ncbi:MAG: CCA tRNA nucleotidyltransferase [Acidaminococcaceae bacterium]
MDYIIPEYVNKILKALMSNGYDAYLVGGAVRDLLLEKKPEDYDIVTNAKPDEIITVAKKRGFGVVEELGQNFGVVMVVVDDNSVEVATYRSESYGEDAHRPESVWYCETLAEDLARRDFTINAIALDSEGRVIDYFNGLEDLKNRKLRTVGQASQRFAEDALRMFRACRFISQLGVSCDAEVFAAITEQLQRVSGLSMERVRTEINKLMKGEFVNLGLDALIKSGLAAQFCRNRQKGREIQIPILPELSALVGVPQNPNFHIYDVWNHTLKAVGLGEKSLEVRWALLLHDIGKGQPSVRGFDNEGNPTDYGHEELSARMAEKILKRFQFSATFVKRVVWLIANHMQFGFRVGKDEPGTRRWLRRAALSGAFRWNKDMQEAFAQLTSVCLADLAATNAHEQEIIAMHMYSEEVLRLSADMPVHTSDLLLSGKQIAAILGGKQYLPQLMKILLKRVQDGTLQNSEESLTVAVKKWHQRRLQYETSAADEI